MNLFLRSVITVNGRISWTYNKLAISQVTFPSTAWLETYSLLPSLMAYRVLDKTDSCTGQA